MLNPTKSILFNTSSGTDVQYVDGDVRIPGLDPIRQFRIVDFSQINYRAEVVQVVTIGATAYTPTGSTPYIVTIGDNRRVQNKLVELPFIYTYVTPVDITVLGATPALQREAISLALIARINAKVNNWTNAVTLGGGAGFTITDDAGYFPASSQTMNNREGASTIKLRTRVGGGGFAINNIVLTTAAIYASGVGALLASFAPVFDLTYSSLIAGYVLGPKTILGATAVGGQRYNLFSISYLADTNLPTIATGYIGFSLKNQQVWVDNGAGSSSANLNGYIALERSMHRGIANRNLTTPTAQIDFLDNVILFQGPAGAVPATTGESKMVSDAKWVYNNIGTNVVAAPTPSNAGLIIDQTLVAGNGAEYTPSLLTLSPKEFVVGKVECSVFARVTATTIANCAWLVGFRVKAAHSATFAYSGIGAVGTTAAAPTLVSTQGSLTGTVVSTVSATVLVNAINYAVLVSVDINGLVTCKINDVTYPVYSVGTTPLVLTAGMVIIPFFRGVNVGGSAALLTVSEVMALPTRMAIA